MRVILGIDTGGTYTDAVLYDEEEQKLLDKNKALTTHHNLTEGITNSIEGLEKDLFYKVELVALSTTLATNAVVEGNGARVGILLLGYDQELMEQFALDQKIPTTKQVVINGKVNIKGEEIEELDKERVKQIGLKWKDEVDVFAVSGYMSVRNSKHEIMAKEILEEKTDLPVVCGHSLTNKLNSIKRAATVVLNASLIPIIKKLNQEVRDVLNSKKIDAPLLVVKGDGSLVKDEVIVERPIETILSGPAASTIGAKYLNQIDDAIIVDMGGTTTDIALIKDGYPRFDPRGAVVGGWLSSIEAIKFKTIGLGGDSQINLNQEGQLVIGPKRVVPYSVAATKDKNILKELKRMNDGNLNNQGREFLILNRVSEKVTLSEREEELIDLLKFGPKSLSQITRELSMVSSHFLRIERLERLEIIKRIGLTPTDILHVLGEYEKWDRQAAKIGFELMISEIEMDQNEFASKVKEEITKQGAKEIATYLINEEYDNYEEDKCGLCDELLTASLENKHKNFAMDFKFDLPIIIIGAPARAYLKQLDKYLNTEIRLPNNYEVANAIGAAVGSILVKEEVLIKPNPMKGNYIVHSRENKKEFVKLDEAVNYAKEIGREIAVNRAKTAGANEVEVDLWTEKRELGSNSHSNGVLLEIKVKINVLGSPYANI